MFVVIKRSKTSKRELVYIVESYRDENQRIRQRIIKKCGELSELVASDPDAIEKLKEEARRMTEKSSSKEVELTINLSMPNSKNSATLNYGFFFVEALYRSLKLEGFIDRHFEDPEVAKRVSNALKYFVIREFFIPLTGQFSPEDLEPLFSNPNFSPTPSLDSVGLLFDIQEDLYRHVYRVVNKGYEVKDKVASLDITSYFFNSKEQSTRRSRKSARSDEDAMKEMILVQVGMLFDRYRNPAACVIFPEGSTDTEDLIEEITRLRKKFGLKRIVLTSDRGLGSNSNLAALYESGNGYVVGRNVKNTPPSFQETILDESGYKWNEAGTFKFKTFMTERVVGDTVIPEKVISMWTSHNAAKVKQRRDKTIVDFLTNPGGYDASGRRDMDKYVRLHDAGGSSDEASEAKQTRSDRSYFTFDAESYMNELALDGYYALVTTELDIPETVIIRRYHNLQKLGRAFAAPDPDVEGAPDELWTYSDVQAYFLINFLKMVMERKLERMLEFKFSIEELKAALNSATCKNIGQDIFDISMQTPVFHEIEKVFGVRFDKSYATLEMIRKYRKDVMNGV